MEQVAFFVAQNLVFTFFLLFRDSRFYFRGIYFVCIKKIRYVLKRKEIKKDERKI